MAVESSLNDRKVNAEQRVLEPADQLQNNKQQDNPHADGQKRPNPAHILLPRWRNPLRLNGNVEQIVKPKHRFERGQNNKRKEIFNRKEIGQCSPQ